MKVLMGETDPSHFVLGPDSFFTKIDHPVEQVRWFEVTEFIAGLNALSKFQDPFI